MSTPLQELPPIFSPEVEPSLDDKREALQAEAFSIIEATIEQCGTSMREVSPGEFHTDTSPAVLTANTALILRKVEKSGDTGSLDLVKYEVLEQRRGDDPKTVATLYDPKKGPADTKKAIAYEAPMTMEQKIQTDTWLVRFLKGDHLAAA